MRPLTKIHGGKHYMSKMIINLIPEHTTYVEPFGGMASVLINKTPSKVEVFNDLDERIYNLFSVLRMNPNEFTKIISLVTYSESEFNRALESGNLHDGLYGAINFYIVCRQSIGGRQNAFSASNRSRGGMAGDVNAWLTSIDENLPLIVNRLSRVQIHHRDALEIIRKYDNPETLFYLDPPYMHSTRSPNARDIYGCEMTNEDHIKLLEMILSIKGKFILSGYPSDTYNFWANDNAIRHVDKTMSLHSSSSKNKNKRTERLWFNF